MKYLALRNWETYQHYKDRNPPWIKIYNSLLDDYSFSRLPDETKWHIVASTLLASRTNNRIPADETWITSKTGSTKRVSLALLMSSGMFEEIEDDSDASPVVEQYASKSLDQRQRQRQRQSRGESDARQRATRLPPGWILPDDLRDWAIAQGMSPERVRDETERIINWSQSSPNGTKMSWAAAWRNWVKTSLKERPDPKARQPGSRFSPTAPPIF